MSRNRELLLGVCLLAVFGAVLLAPSVSHAAYSCEQQLRPAKRAVGDLNFPRPHMGIAAEYLIAAEAALEAGDEARCLENLKKAEPWIRKRSRRHDR